MNTYSTNPILRLWKACIIATVLSAGLSFADSNPRKFSEGSLAVILAAREARPFMVIFWSVDCPSCPKELVHLPDYLKKYPQLDIVMVSTDDFSQHHSVQSVLDGHGLSHIESWVFAGSNPQRLRYEVDSTWYGELPRTYFYTATHERVAVSGVLNEEHIGAWASSITHP